MSQYDDVLKAIWEGRELTGLLANGERPPYNADLKNSVANSVANSLPDSVSPEEYDRIMEALNNQKSATIW